MLSTLVKERNTKVIARKELQEIKRKEALLAANELTQALVEHLNLGVAQAYLNQRKIDEEAKRLQQNMQNFSKQALQWVNMINGFTNSLKQIGDLENWSRIIEQDMNIVSDSLELVYKNVSELQLQ